MNRQSYLPFLACGALLLTPLSLAGCDSDTGGGGGDGSGTLCEGLADSAVFACIDHAALPSSPAAETNLTGVVAEVRAPAPGEPCVGNHKYTITRDVDPEVMIDLTSPEGDLITVGIAAPGFSESSVAAGETLDIHLAFPLSTGFDIQQLLEIRRDGALVVAVGRNLSSDLTISEGSSECWLNDPDCNVEARAIEVSAGGASVSISTGKSQTVGDLLVTNDGLHHLHPENTSCDGPAIDYIMSAARQ